MAAPVASNRLNPTDDALRDLWASILHASRKLPRQDPSHPQPPSVPTGSQLRLLALLTALQRAPDPVPIPPSHVSLLDMDAPAPSDDLTLDWSGPAPASASDSGAGTSTRKTLRWMHLPLFEETVLQALSDEPGRRAGFSALETTAWERLVAFLALVAKQEVVHLEGVAVAMIRWALEVRHDDGTRVSPAEMDSAAAAAAAAAPAAGAGTTGEQEQRGVGRGAARKGHVKARSGGSSRAEGEDDPATRARLEATRLNVYVAAAALWAIIMGEELWQRRGEEGGEEGGGPSATAQIGRISKRRWNMWIDRLRFLSLREDLTVSTRELAAEAAAVMVRVV
ncbi:hypothetical protein BDV59DRAFT_185971 [Aspergillus ambiguus]|uniref:uncharacterized protein n=1 Tax=Aspergillus ambiguus TaxID=176160 RepID=UPI003CCD1CFF